MTYGSSELFTTWPVGIRDLDQDLAEPCPPYCVVRCGTRTNHNLRDKGLSESCLSLRGEGVQIKNAMSQ